MKQRCFKETNKKYPNYGGRGITVCERWTIEKEGYHNFISDMGKRPTDDYSIERVNVNGNYEPSNCIWLPMNKQQLNKQNTAVVLPGERFGKLTVLYETEGKLRNSEGTRIRRFFRVKCECGSEKDIRMDKLRQRENQSCGNRSCNKYAPINETI
jgi:hypothetical protein